MRLGNDEMNHERVEIERNLDGHTYAATVQVNTSKLTGRNSSEAQRASNWHNRCRSAPVAILAVSNEVRTLVHVAGDLGEGHGQGRVRGLRHATALLLQRQLRGLGEARVGDLVVQKVHDLP